VSRSVVRLHSIDTFCRFSFGSVGAIAFWGICSDLCCSSM
jgi:hypothetical protein